jgi:hypothetical protein
MAARRAKPAKVEPTLKFHPLFPPPDNTEEDELPEYTEEHISRIMVGRYDVDGKFRTALRTYEATELRSLSDVFSVYGGGTYDLMAVNSQGRIFRRPRYILEGAPKSLNGADPAAQPQAVQPSGQPQPIAAGDPLSAMMQFMGSLITVQIQQQGALLTALVAGKNNQPAPVDPMTQVAPLINALSNFMPKPQPSAPAQPPPDPIKLVRDINALQKELVPPPAEEKVSEVITASVGAIAPVIGQLLTRGSPAVPALGPAG